MYLFLTGLEDFESDDLRQLLDCLQLDLAIYTNDRPINLKAKIENLEKRLLIHDKRNQEHLVFSGVLKRMKTLFQRQIKSNEESNDNLVRALKNMASRMER
jgi:hypothetical protein